MRWRHVSSCIEEVKALQAAGWKVCVLEQTHNSVPLDCFAPLKEEKYAIVAGNEVHGVDQQVVDAADYVLEIPQFGAKHSLNVSVSVGIALWTFFAAMK